MKNHYISRFSTILIICSISFFLTAACTGSETVTEQPEAEDQQERSIADLETIYWERIQESRMNFTDADVKFMHDMIPHHAQALIMSRLAPENDASRSVQTLAARIINAQGDEIALMKRWLEDRDKPVPEIHIDGLEMMIHGLDDGHDGHGHDHGHGHNAMEHHHDMPGMLTQEQLEELAAARGSEFDRKFLEFMIEHHEGAVIMVDELFAADGAASDREMFDLASGIYAEQVTEIERMKLMLEQMNE